MSPLTLLLAAVLYTLMMMVILGLMKTTEKHFGP